LHLPYNRPILLATHYSHWQLSPINSPLSAIIVAFGAEPWLERSVEAVLASQGVEVEVVLVDNGCTDGAVERLAGRAGVTVVRPGKNTGFARGCHLGVAASRGELLAFVNPDALVESGALAALARVASRAEVGLATGSIRLADHPELVNSAGDEIHFLGVSWAGHFGEPAAEHSVERPVFAAHGAGMAARREVWDELGGFEPQMFAYYEDAELSVRCWQRGLNVVYVPDAVIVHRYEFARHASKFYLAERNRLIMVLTGYELRTLVLLSPLLLALEAAVLLLALLQGWGWSKIRGWLWLLSHPRWLYLLRRGLQRSRTRSDRDLAPLFTDRLAPPNFPLPRLLLALNPPLASYWRWVSGAQRAESGE